VIAGPTSLATRGDVTREQWDRIAVRMEGEAGARVAKTLIIDIVDQSVHPDAMDDEAMQKTRCPTRRMTWTVHPWTGQSAPQSGLWP
jgi:hypothetical protein